MSYLNNFARMAGFSPNSPDAVDESQLMALIQQAMAQEGQGPKGPIEIAAQNRPGGAVPPQSGGRQMAASPAPLSPPQDPMQLMSGDYSTGPNGKPLPMLPGTPAPLSESIMPKEGEDGALGLPQDFWRGLVDFGSGLSQADQAGMHWGAALGHGATQATAGIEARRAAEAEQQRIEEDRQFERDMANREDARAERGMDHDINMAEQEIALQQQKLENQQEMSQAELAIANARLAIAQAEANRDPVGMVEIDSETGMAVGITDSGKTIDLGFAPAQDGEDGFNEIEALEIANKVSTTTTTNEFGQETEARDTGVYNSTLEKLGYGHLGIDEPVNTTPTNDDGSINANDLRVGQIYQLGDGRRARWNGEGFQIVE